MTIQSANGAAGGLLVTAAPEIAHSDDGNIPATGTGLAGRAWAPGTDIRSISDLIQAMGADPAAVFTASEIAYGSRNSDTTLEEFLDHDGGSITGNGDVEMGPSGIQLTGYLYIPPGTHTLSVISDDGFALSIGGSLYSLHSGGRSAKETAQAGEFEGGLYEVELLYFDQGGSMALTMHMDGMPIDDSAFYKTPDDFLNPPDGMPLIPAADYHPGTVLGDESLDAPVDGTGTEARDVIQGLGQDDTINGLAGDDEIMGGYGDDILDGGDGNDVLDGQRGSDVLIGGKGDDLLIARSDAGEQVIGQNAIGMPTRGDPDGEVNPLYNKLAGYEDQPLHGDDVLIGGEGKDTFLISPQLNGKKEIIEKHVQADGSINWAGVAGENNEVHDHWTDSVGIDLIADYDADEDQIAVIGHTANVYVTYEDVIGDEAEESIINIVSNQHGGGGAHAMDLIGQVIVHGDRVEVDDIQTDDGVTYGIVEGYQDIAEALYPQGDTKYSTIDGVEYKGYDTRSPSDGANMQTNAGLGTENAGAVTGNPAAAFQNDNFTEDMLVTPEETPEIELTRDPFEQLGAVEVEGQTYTGTNGQDRISQEMPDEPSGLPGALGYWSFSGGVDGAYANGRGEGNDVKAYTLYENQALLRTDGETTGPGAAGGGALTFDGEDDFAFLEHDPAFQVTQGTIAMWVRPDDLGDWSTMVSKDQSGTGDGGHFRIGHTNEGGLFLRMAPGNGEGNKAWKTEPGLLDEGAWQHIAVSFTEDGVNVYLDGNIVGANKWSPIEGNVSSPNVFTEAYLVMNEEPIVFGADSYRAELNDTAAEFAIDREDLQKPFEGAIGDFGLWGGFTKDDVLSRAEIRDLMQNGPGEALTNPSGVQPMIAADDTMMGGAGADVIHGGAGDDVIMGENGADTLYGGYGDDHLQGGAGADTMDGGWGSDLLEGGAGHDTLISRSDIGEDRAGQLVLGEPSRPYPDPSIDPETLKLIDWADQPLIGDDVLVGGDGNDHFKFETLINAKVEHLVENTKDDGRTINWHKVAGENAQIHDHWVDGIGVDVIADYVAGEDKISVIGHTTQIEVDYVTVDTNGDGIDDDAASVITVYSQQGNGGGAHDEDYLGYIVVYGDKVDEDDIETDAGAHYGVVDTIDELQEAVAPDGPTKTHTDPALFGYDSRDVDGDPIGSNPIAYSDNAWLKSGAVELASAVPDDLEMPTVLMQDAGGSFDGTNSKEIAHTPDMLLKEGTIAFTFTADNPASGQDQTLFSKDHSGYKDGGHVTAYLRGNGELKLRFQDENTSYYLRADDKIEAGQEYHVAFTFHEDEIALYVDGELVDVEDGTDTGMEGNAEDIVLGASTMYRQGDNDNLTKHFDGEVGDVVVMDRALEPVEAIFLAAAGGDPDAMAALYGEVAAAPEPEQPAPPAEEPEAPEEPVAEEPQPDPEPEVEDPAPEEPEAEAPGEEDPAPEEPQAEDPQPEPEPEVEDPAPEDPAPEEPVAEDPAPEEPEEPAPETPEAPAEEELEPEEEEAISEILSRIIDILFSLLRFGGGEETAAPDAQTDDGMEDDGETLLSDILPILEAIEDDTAALLDEDDEMEAMAGS